MSGKEEWSELRCVNERVEGRGEQTNAGSSSGSFLCRDIVYILRFFVSRMRLSVLA